MPAAALEAGAFDGDAPALELVALTKRYGDVVALDAAGFTVPAGEVFGFVGSNGAGKTTAMRIALGVLAADAGEVRYGGAPITAAQRSRIGYMPEQRGLYPKMRVLAQLTYLARLHGFARAAAAAAAAHWLERLELGERRADEVQQLSLGNQQRVQLAAALVHDPDVLVLDEPFSGLDPIAVDMLTAVLGEQAARGVPIVFSSHQLELVERICDRVGIISNGRMVATGTVAQLTAGGASRISVHAPQAHPGWAAELPGVRVLEQRGGASLLELDNGVDEQSVLHAALATGPVTEFRQHRPGLPELFRDVVTDNADTEGSA